MARRRAGQRRQSDHADLPQAHARRRPRRSARGSSSRRPARRCATSCASTPRQRLRLARPPSPGFFVGGKTGTAEKVIGGRYSKNKNSHHLHGDRAGRQAALSVPHHHGRAAGDAGDPRLLDRRLECRRRHRQHHRAGRRRCSACRRASSRRSSLSRSWRASARGGHADERADAVASRPLGDLFPEAQGTPGASTPVAGIASDSRKVKPGSVFVAVPGTKADGMSFVPQARRARRRRDRRRRSRGPRISTAPSPICAVADVRRALALAARALHPRQPEHDRRRHRHQRQESSVADFARQLFAALGHESASLGTLGVITSEGAAYGSLTTPDPISLHETLDRLAGEGVTQLAMEASSHGIDQRRLDGVRLAAARLHQSRPRPPRLSRHDRGLCGGQAAPLRDAAAGRCAGGDQRRRTLTRTSSAQAARRRGLTADRHRARRRDAAPCSRRGARRVSASA